MCTSLRKTTSRKYAYFLSSCELDEKINVKLTSVCLVNFFFNFFFF